MLARPRKTRFIRWIFWTSLALGLAAAWVLAFTDNFGVVVPGELYRSGQMGAESLASRVRQHRVKTVLNLRGSHPESSWYRDERAATLGEGATQVDLPLSSCEWLSRAQARALLEVLETAERPILIHCFHGSERTAMVSAFATLLRDDSTFQDAEAQFSIRHLYFGLGDGVVTRQHLRAYEGWLQARSLDHTPNAFRRWIRRDYRPGEPSREQYLYDPYPLVVVTRGVKAVASRR